MSTAFGCFEFQVIFQTHNRPLRSTTLGEAVGGLLRFQMTPFFCSSIWPRARASASAAAAERYTQHPQKRAPQQGRQVDAIVLSESQALPPAASEVILVVEVSVYVSCMALLAAGNSCANVTCAPGERPAPHRTLPCAAAASAVGQDPMALALLQLTSFVG